MKDRIRQTTRKKLVIISDCNLDLAWHNPRLDFPINTVEFRTQEREHRGCVCEVNL